MEHGTLSAYSGADKCRCLACCKVHTRYMKLYRMGKKRTVCSVGTQRRIQGLCWMGWTMDSMAAQLGICRTNIGDILRQPTVGGARAAEIARLFNELHMTPGGNLYAARKARFAGWLPPLAWDEDTIDDPAAVPDLGHRVAKLVVDESAVDRVLSGQRTDVNLLERREALSTLCKLDLTNTQIAERIGCTKRTVERYRKANRDQVGH